MKAASQLVCREGRRHRKWRAARHRRSRQHQQAVAGEDHHRGDTRPELVLAASPEIEHSEAADHSMEQRDHCDARCHALDERRIEAKPDPGDAHRRNHAPGWPLTLEQSYPIPHAAEAKDAVVLPKATAAKSDSQPCRMKKVTAMPLEISGNPHHSSQLDFWRSPNHRKMKTSPTSTSRPQHATRRVRLLSCKR